MSWIQKLYETYENCQSMIGKGTGNNEIPLLPICHTTQMAQIEIVIDHKGNFRRARVIPKDDARTIIPSTEKSAGRTHVNAHPLCDKLQYVARDYNKYGGRKKSGYAKTRKEKNKDETYYYDQMRDWCSSPHKHPKANAVFEYIQKGNVIKDLIDCGVLISGGRGKLMEKSDKHKEKDIPEIFKVIGEQAEAFVRWEVERPNDPRSKLWQDPTLWDSWIKYYTTTKKNKDICYVTGQRQFIAEQHPKKIRNDGDGAKLISSNDTSGFTFRGRFLTAEQAAGVSFEVTQKAHSALRWLINRQGYRKEDQAIVAWATSGVSIPKPTDDPLSILGFDELPSDKSSTASTAQDLAIKLKKKISGYGKELGGTTGVVVMGLDSATPGRMAMTYYRELTGSDFLQRINHWHDSCAWIHNYHSIEVQDNKTGKMKKKYIPFTGAPAPSDIAEAAYGRRVDDKLRKTTVERILPCIIDGQQIPRDLVESTVRRASNRVGMEDWEWNKTLTIACALYKKYNREESYNMALDPNRNTRDYLYGRLLALADSLEGWALNKTREDRETNAARLMQRFSERPYSTWRTIELALAPYKARLGGKSKKRQRMIDEVICSFNDNDFLSDKRLSGEFLLGYHCQREFLRNTREQVDDLGNQNSETANTNNQ